MVEGGTMMRLLVAGIIVGFAATAAEAQQRIDVYDKYSRREGYVIVNERQGRADFYDKYSRRTGYATFKPQRPGSQEPPGGLKPSGRGPR